LRLRALRRFVREDVDLRRPFVFPPVRTVRVRDLAVALRDRRPFTALPRERFLAPRDLAEDFRRRFFPAGLAVLLAVGTIG
jgi:hypothetical protein